MDPPSLLDFPHLFNNNNKISKRLNFRRERDRPSSPIITFLRIFELDNGRIQPSLEIADLESTHPSHPSCSLASKPHLLSPSQPSRPDLLSRKTIKHPLQPWAFSRERERGVQPHFNEEPNPTRPDPTRPVHADIAAWRGCPDEIETGGKADIRPADRNTIIIQAAVHGPHNGFLQGEGKGVSREGEGRSNLVARSRINSARIEGPKSACSPPPVNIPEKSWRHPAPGRGDYCVISFHFSGGGTNSWRLNLGKEFIFASDSKVVCLDV